MQRLMNWVVAGFVAVALLAPTASQAQRASITVNSSLSTWRPIAYQVDGKLQPRQTVGQTRTYPAGSEVRYHTGKGDQYNSRTLSAARYRFTEARGSLALVRNGGSGGSSGGSTSGYTPTARERAWMEESTRYSFPRLGSSYRIIGPMTRRYNCISHTIGDTSYWEWPGDTVRVFNSLYARHGYRRLPTMNTSYEPGVSKIALYAKTEGGRRSVTHGALQTPSGDGWTSKLGRGPTIWHPTPGHLTGPSYGRPIHVYAKGR